MKENEAIAQCDDMLRQLIGDNETVIETIRMGLPAAQNAADEAGVGLLTERLA